MKITKLNKVAIGLASVLALGACNEVQLLGPAEGATVELDSLQNPGTKFQSITSSTRAEMSDYLGEEKWDSWADWQRFIWLGNVLFETSLSSYGISSQFLITAKYGQDSDANFDKRLDNYPENVHGEWHAVVTGWHLDKYSYTSVLTEAAYQFLINDPEYKDYLDGHGYDFNHVFVPNKLREFARNVVSDVDDDGNINYIDVARWNNQYHRGKYQHDPKYLDALANGIIEGADQEEIARLAQQVYQGSDVKPPEPEPLPEFQEIAFSGPVTESSSYNLDPCNITRDPLGEDNIYEKVKNPDRFGTLTGTAVVDWKRGLLTEFRASVTFEDGETELHDFKSRNTDFTSVTYGTQNIYTYPDGSIKEYGHSAPEQIIRAARFNRYKGEAYAPMDPYWDMNFFLTRDSLPAPDFFLQELRVVECETGYGDDRRRSISSNTAGFTAEIID